MKPLLLLSFLLSTTALSQPITYTPAQIERVAKLSELCGHIRFFHPYLGYKPINWDSAFAATAPLVANAKTDEETVAAIRQLLAVLNDDATTAELTPKPTALQPKILVRPTINGIRAGKDEVLERAVQYLNTGK